MSMSQADLLADVLGGVQPIGSDVPVMTDTRRAIEQHLAERAAAPRPAPAEHRSRLFVVEIDGVASDGVMFADGTVIVHGRGLANATAIYPRLDLFQATHPSAVLTLEEDRS